MRPIQTLCLLLVLPSLASATDGVLEINQACVATGCFPGDTADFPVTLTSQAGTSFRLTSDLILPHENVDAIRVGVSGATIDLNGFAIRGVTVCTGEPPDVPVACSPTGSGNGIVLDFAASPTEIAVRNGSIIGMGFQAVLLGERAHLRDLRVSGSGNLAISVSRGSIIESTTIALSGGGGLSVAGHAIIRSVTTHSNFGAGISAGDGSTISDSISRNNGFGFFVSRSSTIRDSTATANGGAGIYCFDSCNLTGNTLIGNATGGALLLGNGSNVTGNTVRLNGAFGLSMSDRSGYSNNVITDNATPGQVNNGANRGGNYCANVGSSTNVCP